MAPVPTQSKIPRAYESFYGNPPNVCLTNSPVLKSAPGRMYCNSVPLATPTLSFCSLLRNKKICEHILFIASFLVPSSHYSFAKENRWFWGGLTKNPPGGGGGGGGGMGGTILGTRYTRSTYEYKFPKVLILGSTISHRALPK